MIFLGIDPGASGGIAVLRDGQDAQAFAMPSTERDLWCVMRDLLTVGYEPGAYFAMIERVASMPGQGVVSTFKFGQSYGSLRMALVAAGVPFEAVSPVKWQRVFGLLKRKGETQVQKKNRHKARAQELFPHLRITHKVADALLIAEYCKRTRAEVKV